MADKKMPYYNRELSWMDFNAGAWRKPCAKTIP